MFGCSVEELVHRISWKEFEEWKAYETLEPWSINKGDRRAIWLMWALANVFKSSTKELPVQLFADLLPDAFSKKLPVTEDELEEVRKPENQKALWSVLKQAFEG